MMEKTNNTKNQSLETSKKLENLSKDERTLVLLEITKKMIIFSNPTFYLKNLERKSEEHSLEKHPQKNRTPNKKENKPERKKLPPKKVETKKDTSKRLPSLPKLPDLPEKKRKSFGRSQKLDEPLRVPKPKLPPQFSYLRPTSQNRSLDLGKLNKLANDPAVRVIECHGPGERITVRGSMGSKPTGVTLYEDEIKDLVQTFSKESKIPIEEGNTQIVIGKYEISIFKNEEKTRFIIRKMSRTGNGPNPKLK